MLRHPKSFALIITLAFCRFALSQNAVHTGTIKGNVVDNETQSPLLGVNVALSGTTLGDATDEAGSFMIENIPVGSYALQFSYIGYEPLVKTDVVVRPKRTTFVEAAMRISAIAMDQVVVSGGYFSNAEDQPTSLSNFSYEEIRRAPGSAGDVSRIIMGLPSLAKVNDQSNHLIVRGGSPIENAFYIDNIEIPNINHFPTQGASGGPIGLVNVDFIRDVNFYTGGFSAIYGDKLSSIMELSFREGNRDEFDGQLDLNFAGFGGVAEGPLFAQRGSWLFSARRSYLDLLVDAIDVGTSVAPRYGDIQGKVAFDLNDRHKLILLGVIGDDHNNPDHEAAVENDMLVYGNQDIIEQTYGMNWRALWNHGGYSNTSISYTATKFEEDFNDTATDLFLFRNRSHERALKLRNVNSFRLNTRNSVDFGVEARQLISNYDNAYAEYTDAFGQTVPQFMLHDRITANKLGGFVNYAFKPTAALTTSLGLRADYLSLNDRLHLSPRFAVSYQLTDRTTLSGSSGLFYQNLPLLLLSQNSAHRNLQDPVAVHYVVGFSHLLTNSTKLTVEIYQKDYRHFPIDPGQMTLFLIDELFYRYGFFMNHENLRDDGKALARGIEVMVQKKLAQNFYGLASAGYFRSRYRGGDGVWRNRVFDNRWIFSVEGGYKPNSKWEMSLRWIYAGGSPFTPLDLAASQQLSRTVLDERHVNAERYPAYHSLNIRFDRRFHFSAASLVFYFSIWNAYNRKNVATYFWNANGGKQDVIYQWTLLPIFGFEFEF
ncbi:MAG TPA: TonB-dependent receptor [bacterium]